MTTTAWTDVTMTVDGVDYPVPLLEVTETRVRAGLEEALRADPLFQVAFECRVRFDEKMRRALHPTRGQRRAARRRQRGRVQRDALRFVREIHALNPWARRDGFSTRLAQDIVRSVQARRGGCDG